VAAGLWPGGYHLVAVRAADQITTLPVAEGFLLVSQANILRGEAQSVEQLTLNQLVAGSNPVAPTNPAQTRPSQIVFSSIGSYRVWHIAGTTNAHGAFWFFLYDEPVMILHESGTVVGSWAIEPLFPGLAGIPVEK
jgi:hypothetical protein